MDTWLLVGRVVFSLIFIGSGIGQMAEHEGSTAYAEGKGVGNPGLMVRIVSVAMLAGGVAVMLGIWTDLAFLLIAIMVMALAFTAHAFWKEDGMAQQMEMSHFMKNLSIAGGALIGFALYGSGYELRQIVGPIGLLD